MQEEYKATQNKLLVPCSFILQKPSLSISSYSLFLASTKPRQNTRLVTNSKPMQDFIQNPTLLLFLHHFVNEQKCILV